MQIKLMDKIVRERLLKVFPRVQETKISWDIKQSTKTALFNEKLDRREYLARPPSNSLTDKTTTHQFKQTSSKTAANQHQITPKNKQKTHPKPPKTLKNKPKTTTMMRREGFKSHRALPRAQGS